MKLNKKLLAAAAVISSTAISAAWAADVDIDANVLFRSAVSFGAPTAMDFGTIDFTGSAGAATIALEVQDATLTEAGATAAEYTAAATGTLGSVAISGENGSTVNITCETGGTLANAAGDSTIALINTEIEFNGANETACAGIGSGALSIALTGSDTITMGGTLNLTAAPNAEAYSTTNTNGVAVQLTAVY